ncbi:MAG: TonB-dependent receptor [Blastocatellia bacterium]|nr:TonB-dependent receptor [Blastocatellia bacterium]
MTKTGTKLFRLFIVFCVVSVYAPLALPQGQTTGAIQGRVYDIDTNLPVAEATITVRNQDLGLERTALTRSDGSYVINILPPGSYTISATHPEYEPASDSTISQANNFAVRISTINQVAQRLIGLRKKGSSPQPPVTQPPVQPPSDPGSVGAGSTEDQLTNTVTATRGGNFDRLQLLSLPLPGIRSFDSLAFLLPGVAPPPQAIGQSVGPGIGAGIGTAGQFSVNGNRSRANNFTIDGSDNNDQDVGVRRQGFLAPTPQNIESLQEFRISTLLWDAELGRNPGSQVNAVTRSGSGDVHGHAYGFFTDDKLNARNAFDFTDTLSAGGILTSPNGKDQSSRLQMGFALGGEIIPNRTFLFGSFEYMYLDADIEQHFATPTSAERRFQGEPFLGVLTPFAFDYVTDAGATPAGLNLFQFYPLPNNPGGPYGANTLSRILSADGQGPSASLRLTHQLMPNHILNARYNFTDDDRELPSIKRAINSSIESHVRTQNLSLIVDSSFSSTLVNQARISFGRTRLDFDGESNTFRKTFDSEVLIVPRDGSPPFPAIFPTDTGPIGELIIRPFSPVGIDAFLFPQERASNTFQYADTMSKTFGNHLLKFGADIRRVHLNSRQDRNYRPLFEVNNGLVRAINLDTGASEIRFLRGVDFASLGQVSSVQQTLTAGTPDSTIGLRLTEYDFFINDNWRIRPNFSFDYGLRYEYNTVPREVNDRIEQALRLEGLPTPGSSSFDTPERTEFFNSLIDAYKGILNGRTRIYESDSNNFGPHIGFAWDPWSNGKTSIRAGYGVYYDAVLGAVVNQSRSVFPTEIPINLDALFFASAGLIFNNPVFFSIPDGQGNTSFLIAPGTGNQFGAEGADFPALLAQLLLQGEGATGGLAFTIPEKDLRTPYVQQWHLTIEQELFRDFLVSAAYVGTKGNNLTRLTTPNGGPSVTSFNFVLESQGLVSIVDFTNPVFNQFPINRANEFLGAFQVFENSARSNYHALQLEGRKRYSQGFTFTTAYTWAHSIDQVSDIIATAGAPVLPQDSFNLNGEKANSSFDARHRFSASLIWDLPFYRELSGSISRWLGGWQIASIFQAHTGPAFTLGLPIDTNLDGNLTDRPITTEGLIFFDEHGSQRVALAPGREVIDFFSLDPGSSGNGAVGRNTVRGDSFINLDLALSKRFRFTETQNFEFRTEFFNVLNRANFGIPIRVIGDPGFGSSIDTVNPARTIQFAFKYNF